MRPLIHNPAITDDMYDEALNIAQVPGVREVVDAATDASLEIALLVEKLPERQRSRETGRLLRQRFKRHAVIALPYIADDGQVGLVVAKGAEAIWNMRQTPGTHRYTISYLMVPDFQAAADLSYSLGDLGDPVVAVRDLVA